MKFVSPIKNALRRYFFLGVITFLPLVITVKFLFMIIGFFDSILAVEHGRFFFFLPERYHPQQWIGFPIPGLGVIFSILCILALGALSRNYFGKKFLRWGDSIVDRIPLARSIYRVVKDMMNIYANHEENQFNKVVLVRFPTGGSRSLGFVTGKVFRPIEKLSGTPMVSVFMPTTPNPTSGFLLFVPQSEVIELDLTVEDAFKIIISGGMVLPDEPQKESQP